MDSLLILLQFFQNEIQRFRSMFEVATEDNPESKRMV